MSYSAPAPLAAKFTTGAWAPCFLWAIIPEDATLPAYLFCDHDKPLTVVLTNLTADETTRLSAVSNLFLPTTLTAFSELEARSGTDLATHDVEGASFLVSVSGISRDVILSGKLDGAAVIVGLCDRNSPTDGGFIRFKGLVDTPELVNGAAWKITITSLLKKLDHEPTRIIAPECDLEFGGTSATEPDCAVKGIKTDPPIWTAATAYTGANGTFNRKIESLVRPTVANGFYYWATRTGGTSGGTQPTWPTTDGATIVDGTVTWTATPATRQNGAVTAITDANGYSREFDIDINTIDDHFTHGVLKWLTGRNTGKTYPVLNYNGGTPSTVVLGFQPLLPIQVGDTFLIVSGCSKSFDAQLGIDGAAYVAFYPDLTAAFAGLTNADWAYIQRLGYERSVEGYAQFHWDFGGKQEGRTMFYPITNQGCAKWRNQRRFGGLPYVPGAKLRAIKGMRQTET